MLKYDVVIATYNGEKYIDEQLNSILSQTVKPNKIYIRDDRSSDTTVDKLRKFSKENSDIIIIPSDMNVGYISNFNILSEHAKSDIVFFSDQDDVWMLDKAEKVLAVFRENNIVNAIFSNAKITNEKLQYECDLFDLNGFSNKDLTLKAICSRNFVTGATLAVRNVFLKRHLPFPSNISHDYYLAFKALIHNELFYIDECLIYYRQHSSNVIGVKFNSVFNKLLNVRKVAPVWLKQVTYVNILSELNSSCLHQDFVIFSKERCGLTNKNLFSGVLWMVSNADNYRKYVKSKDIIKDLCLLFQSSQGDTL